MDDMNQGSTIILGDIFKKAFAIYKDGKHIFIPIGLVYGFANVFDGILLRILPNISNGVILFFNILITSVASMAIIYAGARIYQKKEVSLQESFLSIRGRYWLFVAVSSTAMIILGLGTLLFILPGLYFATIFVFSNLLVVIEDAKFTTSFQRSAQLVRGPFWRVLQFNLIFFLTFAIFALTIQSMANLGQMLGVCFGVFILPFYALSEVCLYYKIKDLQVV